MNLHPKNSSDIRAAVELLAGPRGWNTTRERWLEGAATRAGVSYRSIRAAFYGEFVGRKTRQRILEAAREAEHTQTIKIAERLCDIAVPGSPNPNLSHHDRILLLSAAGVLSRMVRAV